MMKSEHNDIKENNLYSQVIELDSRLSAFIDQKKKDSFWKDTLIPALSLLVALAGIFTSTVIQFASLRSQTNLKQYEVTFIAKQKAYSDFMTTIHALLFSSTGYTKDELLSNIYKLNGQAFAIQPFLRRKERDMLQQNVHALAEIAIDRFKLHQAGDKDLDISTNKFLSERDNLQDWLSLTLFPGDGP